MTGSIGQLVTTVVVAGALIMVLVLGRPAAIERRGRNPWVGIRIPSTLASEAAWVAAHRAAWPATRLGCGIGVVLTLVSTALAAAGAVGLSAVVIGTGLMCTLVLVLVGVRTADRAARRANSADADPQGQPR